MAKVIYSSSNPPPKRGLDCSGDVSPVQQHFKEACDVNQVINRYARTGVVSSGLPTSLGSARPMYGDFVGLDDFQSCQNRIIAAQQGFAALPSRIRSRFGNDPRQLVAFLADEANFDEAVALGLVSKPRPEPKAPVSGDSGGDAASPVDPLPKAAPKPPKAKAQRYVAVNENGDPI